MTDVSMSREALNQAKATALAICIALDTLPTLAPVSDGQDAIEYDCRVLTTAIGSADSVAGLADQIEVMSTFVHDHASVAGSMDMQAAGLAMVNTMLATVTVTASPSIVIEQALARRIAKGFAILFICEAAAAACRRSFASRDQATTAREAILSAFDTITATCDEVPEDVIVAARECVTSAVRHIDETAGSLAPLARIEMSKSVPSTALAWALYRDPSRAPDLVAAARTGTSLFMPTTIVAPSR